MLAANGGCTRTDTVRENRTLLSSNGWVNREDTNGYGFTGSSQLTHTGGASVQNQCNETLFFNLISATNGGNDDLVLVVAHVRKPVEGSARISPVDVES